VAKSVDFDLVDIIDIAQQLNLKLHSIQGGKQYETHCWKCEDESIHGKLTINPIKGVYRCAKCGYSGNVYTMAYDILGSKESALELLVGNKLDYQPQQRRKQALPKENSIAPIDIRHAVYTAFLKRMILHSSHRQDLRSRGLSDAIIQQKGYKSTLHWDSTVGVCYLLQKEGYSLQGIPGFYEKDGQWLFMTVPGFLIPIRDKENRIQGLQIRVDNAILKQKPNLSKYIWKSSAGKLNGTSSGAPVHIARPSKPTIPSVAYITEGPLKSDIAAEYLGGTFIGIAGVGLYKQAVEAAKELGITTAPVLFDMDKLKNKGVKKAETKLLEELRKTGIDTFSIEWNPKAGKGVDDVVITYGQRFKELIDTQIMQHKPQVKQKTGILHNWGKRKKAM